MFSSLLRLNTLLQSKYSFTKVSHLHTSMSSMQRLSGKVAIVTASTDGIGLSIAKRLGNEGAHVVVSSRREKNVNEAVEKLQSDGISVMGLICHVGVKEDRNNLINKTVEKFGGIDILVSNAAVNPTMGGLLQCSDEVWDKVFDVNVKSSLMLTQLVVPHMTKRGGGAIVYVSSIGGITPIPSLAAYSVSKTALLGITKALAIEVAHEKIRVNCVCPGIIKTKFSAPLLGNGALLEEFLKQIPLGRIGEPEEVASCVSFLCSDDASYVTGENFVMAGGMNSRL